MLGIGVGIALLVFCGTVLCQESVEVEVSVFISKKIRPYADALGGVEKMLADKPGVYLNPLWLESDTKEAERQVADHLKTTSPVLVVTIGPEALFHASAMEYPVELPVIYTVVLNPERMIDERQKKICGISLKSPLENQIREIHSALPEVKAIGLLFDPVYNQDFYEEACRFCEEKPLKIVPLVVSSKKEIPGTLDANWNRIDALWMIPDQTVISERIVQYIIKEAISQSKPVIGFNRFFNESGAVMSFEFDYVKLGAQAGDLAFFTLVHGYCSDQDPDYGLLMNIKVAEQIGVGIRPGQGGSQ